jgi:methyl-accepting chemotaxis protein
VANAATQLSSSSQSLAQMSSEQAAALEEVSASTEQINSMARENTEKSHVVSALMTESEQKFHEANQSLQHMVTAIVEIGTESERISKVIKVIDEIAFQTHILALNAAVQAAQAGEAGLGFAVVANEVGNLARRSAQAANDTAALIQESVIKSNQGKTKVDQVSEGIRVITDGSAKVKVLVEEMNTGSQEQARGTLQIGKAIRQMEQVTQQVATGAQESAAGAQELRAHAESLRNLVVRLTAMVGAMG